MKTITPGDPVFQIHAPGYTPEEFGRLEILNSTGTEWCPECRRAIIELDPPLNVCRLYDKWDDNSGAWPDFMFLGMWILVSDRAKSLIQHHSRVVEYESVRVVENPSRRKHYLKRWPDLYNRELERDLSTQVWRVRITLFREVDLEQSKVRVSRCATCGNVTSQSPPDAQTFVKIGTNTQDQVFSCGFGDRIKRPPETLGNLFATEDFCMAMSDAQLSNAAFHKCATLC